MLLDALARENSGATAVLDERPRPPLAFVRDETQGARNFVRSALVVAKEPEPSQGWAVAMDIPAVRSQREMEVIFMVSILGDVRE